MRVLLLTIFVIRASRQILNISCSTISVSRAETLPCAATESTVYAVTYPSTRWLLLELIKGVSSLLFVTRTKKAVCLLHFTAPVLDTLQYRITNNNRVIHLRALKFFEMVNLKDVIEFISITFSNHPVLFY